MRFRWPVEISGVKRVVINRTHVWERDHERDMFVKVKGGPGFKHIRGIPIHHMVRNIDNQIMFYVRNGIPYSFWFNGGTLNVSAKEERIHGAE